MANRDSRSGEMPSVRPPQQETGQEVTIRTAEYNEVYDALRVATERLAREWKTWRQGTPAQEELTEILKQCRKALGDE